MAPCPVAGRKSMMTNPSPPPRQRTAVLGAAVERSRAARHRLGASSRSRRRDEQPLSRLHIGGGGGGFWFRGPFLSPSPFRAGVAGPPKAGGGGGARPPMLVWAAPS